MIWMMSVPAPQKPASEGEQLDSLIVGIAAGDKGCLEELYRRTRAAVYGFALSYLKDPAEAEDVMQDAFVRVWDAAAGFRPQGKPMAWLMTIVRNLALGRLRETARTGHMEPEQWDALPAAGEPVSPEDRALLQLVMGRLTDEECRIVTLHAAAGLKHREIAQLMELPLPTVLSKYHRALKKLKTMMEGEDRL